MSAVRLPSTAKLANANAVPDAAPDAAVQPPAVAVDTEHTPAAEVLNGAARLLLQTLPANIRTVLLETAEQQHMHLWMLVVGLLQRSYDTGEHTAPVLDPRWTLSMAVAPAERDTVKCKHKECNREYTPRWPGQQYCSNECGAAAARSRRAPARSVERWAVGEEPPGTARSTITISESDGGGSTAPTVGAAPAGEGGSTGGGAGEVDPITEIERTAAEHLGA